jgi:acetyl esterase
MNTIPDAPTAAPAETMADDVSVVVRHIDGYRQRIALRLYLPSPALANGRDLPVAMYFHGGAFTSGSFEDADAAARYIARHAPALVVSVAYSLAPAFPFPAAPEDAYLALCWIADHAGEHGGDAKRIGVAGHDAGGNIAACLALIARDRDGPALRAQALLAPLLDPSMTHIDSTGSRDAEDPGMRRCAQCYRSYLPLAAQRIHPYAAPLESTRLGDLPPALIASAGNDALYIEAETYAAALIAAGVPVQVTRYRDTSHTALANLPEVLGEVAAFFRHRLGVRNAV